MRLRTKARIFLLTYFGGGIAVMALVMSYASPAVQISSLFGWFFLFAISQFFFVRCPYCDHCAFFTREGGSTPFVGSHCRHCGKPY